MKLVGDASARRRRRARRRRELAQLKIVRGELLLQAGADAEAEAEFLHALITTPRIGRAHAALADVYKKRNDLAGALEHLIAAADAPDLEPMRAAACAVDAADVLLVEGDSATAERLYQLAAALDPADRRPVDALARLAGARARSRAAGGPPRPRRRAHRRSARAGAPGAAARSAVPERAQARPRRLPRLQGGGRLRSQPARGGARAARDGRAARRVGARRRAALPRAGARPPTRSSARACTSSSAQLLEHKLLDGAAALRNFEQAAELALDDRAPTRRRPIGAVAPTWSASTTRRSAGATPRSPPSGWRRRWPRRAAAQAARAEALRRAGELHERAGDHERARQRLAEAAAIGGEAGRKADDSLLRLAEDEGDPSRAAPPHRRAARGRARGRGAARALAAPARRGRAHRRSRRRSTRAARRSWRARPTTPRRSCSASTSRRRAATGPAWRSFCARAPPPSTTRPSAPSAASRRDGWPRPSSTTWPPPPPTTRRRSPPSPITSAPSTRSPICRIARATCRAPARSTRCSASIRPRPSSAPTRCGAAAASSPRRPAIPTRRAAPTATRRRTTRRTCRRTRRWRGCSSARGDDRAAYQSLRAVLDLLPLDAVERITELRRHLGELALKLGDREAARHYLELVLSQLPMEARALELLARLYQEQQAWPEAADALGRLSRLVARAGGARRAALPSRRGAAPRPRRSRARQRRLPEGRRSVAHARADPAAPRRLLLRRGRLRGAQGGRARARGARPAARRGRRRSRPRAGARRRRGARHRRRRRRQADRGAPRRAARGGAARRAASSSIRRCAPRRARSAPTGAPRCKRRSRRCAPMPAAPGAAGARLALGRLHDAAGDTARARVHYAIGAFVDPTRPRRPRATRSSGRPSRGRSCPSSWCIRARIGPLRDALGALAPHVLGLSPSEIDADPAPQWTDKLRAVVERATRPDASSRPASSSSCRTISRPGPSRRGRRACSCRGASLADESVARFAAARAMHALVAGVALVDGRGADDVAALLRAATALVPARSARARARRRLRRLRARLAVRSCRTSRPIGLARAPARGRARAARGRARHRRRRLARGRRRRRVGARRAAQRRSRRARRHRRPPRRAGRARPRRRGHARSASRRARRPAARPSSSPSPSPPRETRAPSSSSSCIACAGCIAKRAPAWIAPPTPFGDVSEQILQDLVSAGDWAWKHRAEPGQLDAAAAAWGAALRYNPADAGVLVHLAHVALRRAADERGAAAAAHLDEATAYAERALSARNGRCARPRARASRPSRSSRTPSPPTHRRWPPTPRRCSAGASSTARRRCSRSATGSRPPPSARSPSIPPSASPRPTASSAALDCELPEAGQNLRDALDRFEASVAAAPAYLPTRVAYAEEYATRVRDAALYRRLLEEVVAANANALPEAAPENAEAQRTARRLLHGRR